MPIPHAFIPGDIARANEVNENFNFIMSVLGPLTTPGRVKTTTEFLMGARQNILLTGTQDTGTNSARNFFQIGYNADYNYNGTTDKWTFARFVPSLGGGVIRIGEALFEVLLANEHTGSLQNALTTVFKIVEGTTTNYIYVPKSIHFQNYDGGARNIQDYRLMYTPLSTPAPILDGTALAKSTSVKDAKNYGVPTTWAKAISITTEVLANAASSARLRLYQERSSPTIRYGFSTAAPAALRGGGWGIVPLGEGSYLGKFRMETTANFDVVSAYVTGYWV